MDCYGWMELAREAAMRQDFSTAIDLANRSIDEAEDDYQLADAYGLRGFIDVVADQPQSAGDWLEDAVHLKEELDLFDSARFDAILLRAEVFRRLGHYEEGMQWVDHAEELLPFAHLPDVYPGHIYAARARILRHLDMSAARIAAERSLEYAPSEEMTSLAERRDWEPAAWHIVQTQQWDQLDTIVFDGEEGPLVHEYLLALQAGDGPRLHQARRLLRDPYWRRDASWRAALLERDHPARSLEILRELQDEHQLSGEWEQSVRYLQAELLVNIDPAAAFALVENDENEDILPLRIKTATAAGEKSKAAMLRRSAGDWSAGMEELLAEARQRLDDLIGMDNAKQTIVDWCALVEVARMRGDQPHAGHLVLTGNPGTGKTTLAGIWAQMLWALGLLPENKTLQVSRQDLVGEYVGHTAPKTKAVWERARGGLLFIDEAYSLAGDEFGLEAITTLLELMENERDQVCLVVAGYANRIPLLWDANPGFRSRFNRHLELPDYSPVELADITEKMLSDKQLQCENVVREYVQTLFGRIPHDTDWANAREVRNYIESVLLQQARRVVSERSDPHRILLADVTAGAEHWWENRGSA